jgi:hypothetical protein
MTDKIDDGGPAFPPMAPLESWGDPKQGMSLRDWFAGQALAGLLADPNEGPQDDETLEDAISRIAEGAYSYADAMLEARAKGGGK